MLIIVLKRCIENSINIFCWSDWRSHQALWSLLERSRFSTWWTMSIKIIHMQDNPNKRKSHEQINARMESHVSSSGQFSIIRWHRCVGRKLVHHFLRGSIEHLCVDCGPWMLQQNVPHLVTTIFFAGPDYVHCRIEVYCSAYYLDEPLAHRDILLTKGGAMCAQQVCGSRLSRTIQRITYSYQHCPDLPVCHSQCSFSWQCRFLWLMIGAHLPSLIYRQQQSSPTSSQRTSGT